MGRKRTRAGSAKATRVPIVENFDFLRLKKRPRLSWAIFGIQYWLSGFVAEDDPTGYPSGIVATGAPVPATIDNPMVWIV